VDLLGVESPAADAELAAVAVTFFRLIGFTAAELKLQFNNRRLMDAQITRLGLLDQKLAVFRLIDRRDKMPAEAWDRYAGELGLTPEQLAGLKALLEDRDLWRQSDEAQGFVAAAEALGIGDFLEFDPTVIRGLDYYTGTVLEARDRGGEFRAILGGGRYDNLVGDVGGDRIPGMGFAMGDMVMGLVAQQYGKVPPLGGSPSQVLVTLFDQAGQTDALRLAAELRAAGLRVEWYPEAVKLERQLKYADATGIRYAIIQGPDERASGVVTVKDLKNRSQTSIERSAVAQHLSG
jgi:histidyl-tRNA synthetase